MSNFARKLERRQSAVVRRILRRRAHAKQRATTMRAGIFALAAKQARDKARDEAQQSRRAQWRWLR